METILRIVFTMIGAFITTIGLTVLVIARKQIVILIIVLLAWLIPSPILGWAITRYRIWRWRHYQRKVWQARCEDDHAGVKRYAALRDRYTVRWHPEEPRGWRRMQEIKTLRTLPLFGSNKQ